MRDWLHVGCAAGHDMRHAGGCNAGCAEWCACSVPVHVCSRCGDSDYGGNDEAVAIREACAVTRESHVEI